MDAMIEQTIKNCPVCKENDKTARVRNPPLQPVDWPDRPWQKVAIDIVGPFERAPRDCRFAITMVDYYSKWPEMTFTPQVTTSVVISFMNTVFAREGNPGTIVSDNGCQFLSHEFKNYLKELNIKHVRSSLYYPRANGEFLEFLETYYSRQQLKNTSGKYLFKTHCSCTEAHLILQLPYRLVYCCMAERCGQRL